jgi:hypothetical protein
MNKKGSAERRKNPRLSCNVPVKICQEGGDMVTETANISRSGAYCRVSRFLDPMTKLKIHLLLPMKKNGKSMTKKVSCEGIVVRVEPSPLKDFFNIAIFFSDISRKDSDSIADYISSCFEKTKTAS